MIPGFEQYTQPLSATEMMCAPYIAEELREHVGKEKSINNYELRQRLPASLSSKIDGARMRKILHHVRTSELYNLQHLCAYSRGYYLAANEEELNDYLESLEQRNRATREIEKLIRETKRKLYPAPVGNQVGMFS